MRSSRPRIRPAPRDLHDHRVLQRERAQLPLEVRADRPHMIHDAVIGQLFEDERGRARREQVAAVRAAVIAGGNRLRHALGHERGAHRDPGAERLADRDQIRRPPKRLRMERIARPAKARLHFIGDEQRSRPAARLGDGVRELARQRGARRPRRGSARR